MSIEAINWSFRVRGIKSSEKLVLVALANYANTNDEAWPSIKQLSECTSLDRKTVLKSIGILVECGLIEYTGVSKGETRSVKTYRLNTDLTDASSPQNGTVKQPQKRNCPQNGTVPNFPLSSPEFPAKQSQISREEVPNVGHGTINEPLKEPSGNRQKAQAPFSTDLLIREGVPDDVARDFAELRKRLKAPISETAVKGLNREAQKAGMTLTEVLETVCANGWRGFKADWITKGSGKKTETIAERNARIEREIFGQSLDDEARTIDMEKIA